MKLNLKLNLINNERNQYNTYEQTRIWYFF